MSWTETKTITSARKAHSCSWCAERIEAGSTYLRYPWFDAGHAYTVKMHPECYDAALQEATGECGEIEFCPGDHKRPLIGSGTID